MSARAALNVAYSAVVEHATAEQRADIDAALAMDADAHQAAQQEQIRMAVMASGWEIIQPPAEAMS